MRYRPLGKTGIAVSEIGFGAWGIGGDSYGPTDDVRSREALMCAFDQGINLFDTSDTYGAGHSEKLIGETLSPYRARIILATKGGAFPHVGRQMPQDFSVAHIENALHQSLIRLRTDYVDIYQLHSPSLDDMTEELFVALDRFKATGKVRTIGVSARSPADGLALLARYAFDVVQINFNMMDQRALENGLFECAARMGAGIIARTPFNFGFLAGRVESLTFGENDHRRHWPRAQLERWFSSAVLFDELCNRQRTKAQLALKFCLSADAVSAVIPGMLKKDEVLENVLASGSRLTADETQAIIEIYRMNTFVDTSVKDAVMQKRFDSESGSEMPR